jgi:hypothetical protein
LLALGGRLMLFALRTSRVDGFRAALPSASSAHLLRLVPLRAAALIAAACMSGEIRSINLPLAGFSGEEPSSWDAAR